MLLSICTFKLNHIGYLFGGCYLSAIMGSAKIKCLQKTPGGKGAISIIIIITCDSLCLCWLLSCDGPGVDGRLVCGGDLLGSATLWATGTCGTNRSLATSNSTLEGWKQQDTYNQTVSSNTFTNRASKARA